MNRVFFRVFLLVLLCMPSLASAQSRWELLRNPELSAQRDELSLAAVAVYRVQIAVSLLRRQRVSREPPRELRLWIEEATVLLERLVRTAPSFEVHYQFALLLDLLERYEESFTHLQLAERYADGRVNQGTYYFLYGTVATRLLRFADAARVYERYVQLPLGNDALSSGYCNLAEIYLYLREMDRSIETYEHCIAIDPTRSHGWWGLAVAADRAGREGDAQRAADEAVLRDPSLRELTGPQVFFVPEYEVHYYLGVANEALARREMALRDAPASRLFQLEALRRWEQFLSAAGSDGLWVDRGREHREALERDLSRALTRMVAPARQRLARPVR